MIPSYSRPTPSRDSSNVPHPKQHPSNAVVASAAPPAATTHDLSIIAPDLALAPQNELCLAFYHGYRSKSRVWNITLWANVAHFAPSRACWSRLRPKRRRQRPCGGQGWRLAAVCDAEREAARGVRDEACAWRGARHRGQRGVRLEQPRLPGGGAAQRRGAPHDFVGAVDSHAQPELCRPRPAVRPRSSHCPRTRRCGALPVAQTVAIDRVAQRVPGGLSQHHVPGISDVPIVITRSSSSAGKRTWPPRHVPNPPAATGNRRHIAIRGAISNPPIRRTFSHREAPLAAP